MKKVLIIIIVLALVIMAFYFYIEEIKKVEEGSNGSKINSQIDKSCLEDQGNWLSEFQECENINEAWCLKAGGKFEGCASPCRHDIKQKDFCILSCVPVCRLGEINKIDKKNNKDNLIIVDNLFEEEIINFPLEIFGKARGFWYFEASFPIKLYDENGNLLATAIAQAQSDWMTEDFVPFKAQLNFNSPETEKGYIILEKDNPSGLPENADELRISIKFGKTEEKMKVKIFFNNDMLDPAVTCNKVFPVEREVVKTQAVARTALNELLKGTTEEEAGQEFFTSINSGVKIQSLTIENGIAKVDFDDQLGYQVGGSCRVSAIRAQITETLKQFSSVKDVIISINGRTEDILQP